MEWYADSDFSNIYNFSTMPAENITVYAKWQMKTTGNELTGIRTYDEFKQIKNYSNGNFYLEKDIELDITWEAIESFSGVLDGREKELRYVYRVIKKYGDNPTDNDKIMPKISNFSLFKKNSGEIKNVKIRLDITNSVYTQVDDRTFKNDTVVNAFSEQEDYGFICVYNKGTVHDISIDGEIDFYIINKGWIGTSRVNYYIGGCVGVDTGYISNIKSACDIGYHATYKETEFSVAYLVYTYVGGIAGKSKNIDSCSSIGCDITVRVEKERYKYSAAGYSPTIIGGIAGECENIKKSSVDAYIRSYKTDSGGLVGWLKGKMENCYASTAIRSDQTVSDGGLVGYAEKAQITNSYAICSFYGGSYDASLSDCAGLVGDGGSVTISNCFAWVARVDSKKVFSEIYGGNNKEGIINCEYYDKTPNYYEVVNRLGWDRKIWALGDGSPKINNGKYPVITYENIPAEVVNYNPSAYMTEKGVVLTDPQRIGYTFGGWYLDSYYTTNIKKLVNITEPITLYAKWNPNTYTITFNTVGGEVSKATATVTYDSDYILEVPVRSGYKFIGWYDGTGNSAVAYTDETGKSLEKWSLADGKTLYARWTAV